MQLSNFLEIFDQALAEGHTWVVEFVMKEPKFLSLFYTSLEMQKFVFLNELKCIADESNH